MQGSDSTGMHNELVQRAYDKVLQIATQALHNCKISGLQIEILREENPTYTEIAQDMNRISSLLEKIDNDTELKVTKAKSYSQDIALIAKAIEDGNEDDLQKHYDSLNRRPFL